jgi:hypothetical protein
MDFRIEKHSGINLSKASRSIPDGHQAARQATTKDTAPETPQDPVSRILTAESENNTLSARMSRKRDPT